MKRLIAPSNSAGKWGLLKRQGSLALCFSKASLDPIWTQEINPDATGLFPNFHWQDDVARFAFQMAFLGRMIFLCLVDADFKNTETFYARVGGYEVDRNWPALQAILPGLVDLRH